MTSEQIQLINAAKEGFEREIRKITDAPFIASITFSEHHSMPKYAPPIDKIVEVCAQHFGVPLQLVLASSKTALVSDARRIAMYLTKLYYPQKPYKAIAQHFGVSNHATVISAVKKCGNYIQYNDAFKKHFDIVQFLVNKP